MICDFCKKNINNNSKIYKGFDCNFCSRVCRYNISLLNEYNDPNLHNCSVWFKSKPAPNILESTLTYNKNYYNNITFINNNIYYEKNQNTNIIISDEDIYSNVFDNSNNTFNILDNNILDNNILDNNILDNNIYSKKKRDININILNESTNINILHENIYNNNNNNNNNNIFDISNLSKILYNIIIINTSYIMQIFKV